jgi:hypothetical protein
MNILNKDSLKNILHLRYKYKYKTSTAIKKQILSTIFNTSYSQGALLVPASTSCEGCVNQVLDYVKRNKDTLDYRKLHVIIVAETYEEAQSLMQKNGLNEILWGHISYKQYSSLSDRMGFRPILLLERAEKGMTTTTLDPDALQHLDKKIRFKYFK